MRNILSGIRASVMRQVESGMAPEWGPNLIIDGGFDSGAVWTKGPGWSVSGGVAVANVGAFVNIWQSVAFKVGGMYLVTYEVKTITSGGIRPTFETGGTQIAGITRVAPGIYTQVIPNATPNTKFTFLSTSNGFIGTLDNVILRQLVKP